MSDQEKMSVTPSSIPQAEEIIDLSRRESKQLAASDDQWPEGETEVCEVRSQHIKNGHTFVVTTVRTETTTMTSTETSMEANINEAADNLKAKPLPIAESAKEEPKVEEEQPCCSNSSCSSPEHSNKAIVPLSSSLPSKLLRFHAKRSAQALLHQMDSQNQSLDSQFGSDEGMPAGGTGNSSDDDSCHESMGASAPAMSPPPPRNSPSENGDEKIDVGMGSSIEGSEESEEDDELKPLAVDNHVLHDIDLTSSPTHSSPLSPVADTNLTTSTTTTTTAVLSEANLEKFRKNQTGSHQHHHPHMDNIYLHPNFKYDITAETSQPSVTAINTEQKRVHRSFLTMKKPEPVAETANSVVSQATTISVDNKPLVNEIDTLDPALVPSDELASEITEAVEFYFSNESILKDAFLLKHVKRNKEGFVSLKLVSSFKRVRQLTKEWKVVGNAVRRKSQKIELNDLGTKIRRIDPLPNFDETMPSRTIVVCDLPLDKLTIEKVSDLFSKCGEIALIRILKPGMAIPVDVRQFMNKYPEMQQKECALVEYLESASAREARNLQGPFKVYEMVAPKKKTGKKAVIQVTTPVVRMVENYRYFNDHNYERTRGGSFSGAAVAHDFDLRYRLKRNNSDFSAKTYPTEIPNAYINNGAPQQFHTHAPAYNGAHRGSFAASEPQHQHVSTAPASGGHHHYHYQPRGSISQESGPQSPISPGTNPNYFAYNPRRYSNTSTISANTAANINTSMESTKPIHHQHSNSGLVNSGSGSNLQRRLSNCSQEGGGGYADMVRRTSNCSDNAPQRRDSNCSDNCPCSRRVSDFGQNNEVYRKSSLGSVGSNSERRFSNGSMQFERTFSNASDINNGGSGNNINNSYHRRMSNDFNLDRKQSLDTQPGTPYEDPNVGGGGGGYNVFPRRYSNNFNNISSKLAQYDNAQYIGGRRISTDSGYDRRCSFGSEYEGSPRSRANSFLSSYKHGQNDYDGQPRSRTGSFIDGSPRSRSGSFATRAAEHLVRTPIGPDGSKGFGFRARKMDQTIGPV
ncbi:la ribonucleoprotein translational regulator Achilles [Musca autumnalis]|uniref:la ribonucleoprotein translational regulator Achilles n=1 Tax=Musca autumnalis TaxID=221902 RepID=UPI003CE89A47